MSSQFIQCTCLHQNPPEQGISTLTLGNHLNLSIRPILPQSYNCSGQFQPMSNVIHTFNYPNLDTPIPPSRIGVVNIPSGTLLQEFMQQQQQLDHQLTFFPGSFRNSVVVPFPNASHCGRVRCSPPSDYSNGFENRQCQDVDLRQHQVHDITAAQILQDSMQQSQYVLQQGHQAPQQGQHILQQGQHVLHQGKHVLQHGQQVLQPGQLQPGQHVIEAGQHVLQPGQRVIQSGPHVHSHHQEFVLRSTKSQDATNARIVPRDILNTQYPNIVMLQQFTESAVKVPQPQLQKSNVTVFSKRISTGNVEIPHTTNPRATFACIVEVGENLTYPRHVQAHNNPLEAIEVQSVQISDNDDNSENPDGYTERLCIQCSPDVQIVESSETTSNSELNAHEDFEEATVSEIENAMQIKVEYYDESLEENLEVSRSKRSRMTTENHQTGADNVQQYVLDRDSSRSRDGARDETNELDRQNLPVNEGNDGGDALGKSADDVLIPVITQSSDASILRHAVEASGRNTSTRNYPRTLIGSTALNSHPQQPRLPAGPPCTLAQPGESANLIVQSVCTACKRSVIRSGVRSENVFEPDGRTLKPFKCSACAVYNFSSNRDTALFSSTEFVKKCYICGYSCYAEWILKRHMRSHGVYIPSFAMQHNFTKPLFPTNNKLSTVAQIEQPPALQQLLAPAPFFKETLTTAPLNKSSTVARALPNATKAGSALVANANSTLRVSPQQQDLAKPLQQSSLPSSVIVDSTRPNISQVLSRISVAAERENAVEEVDVEMEEEIDIDELSKGTTEVGFINKGNPEAEIVGEIGDSTKRVKISDIVEIVLKGDNAARVTRQTLKGSCSAVGSEEKQTLEQLHKRTTNINESCTESTAASSAGSGICNQLGRPPPELRIFEADLNGKQGTNVAKAAEASVSFPPETFQCQNCSFQTVSYYRFRKHNGRNKEKKIFTCDKCDFTSCYLHPLRLHVKAEHPTSPTLKQIKRKVGRPSGVKNSQQYALDATQREEAQKQQNQQQQQQLKQQQQQKKHQLDTQKQQQLDQQKQLNQKYQQLDKQKQQQQQVHQKQHQLDPQKQQLDQQKQQHLDKQKQQQQLEQLNQQQRPDSLIAQQPDSDSSNEVVICGEKIANPSSAFPGLNAEATATPSSSTTTAVNTTTDTLGLTTTTTTTTNENTRVYGCAYCDMFSLNRLEILKHLGSHRGSAPYVCMKCQRRFFNQVSLLLHEKIHQWE